MRLLFSALATYLAAAGGREGGLGAGGKGFMFRKEKKGKEPQ